ncbi:MAG: nitroreductase family protein [Chloroflexota bacterium]
MDVYEAIEKRRTVRTFKKGVSEKQLQKIIAAGIKAPSGSNVQPWAFIVIDDPKIIEQIAGFKYLQTLKMVMDEKALSEPAAIEQIYRQTLKMPLSPGRAVSQRDVYRNCTVVAVCNQIGHGIGRKPWMNIENIGSNWMCIQNMALAATADGFGIVPSIFREEYKIAVEKLLCIPEDYELTTIVLIGVQARTPGKRIITVPPKHLQLYRNRFG